MLSRCRISIKEYHKEQLCKQLFFLFTTCENWVLLNIQLKIFDYENRRSKS